MHSPRHQPAPRVSIVIPHFNGKDILFSCLQSLRSDAFPEKEIIVVDNASTDGSGIAAEKAFPEIERLQPDRNLGYAGGCNFGVAAARAPYVVLLNNDTIVEPGWLSHLLEALLSKPEIAAVQPKIKSLVEKDLFDYAGAAGGFLDVLGFPFARGRIFFTIEKDRGQYDDPVPVFWASGTCILLKKQIFNDLGGLDHTFFAHMEEIDLNWRMQLAGHQLLFVPCARIFHSAGSTLKMNSPRKVYFNHRNNLLMLMKNYSAGTLLWVLPLRMGMEAAALLFSLLKGEIKQALAVPTAWLAAGRALPHVFQTRKMIRKMRRRSDRDVMKLMYPGSIVIQYFLFRKRTFKLLNWKPELK